MFGSGWTNPQQNQQGGSAFGQPSGFGGSAFGSGGAFGQNPQQPQQSQGQQPQPQPQANPMFGNFGGTNTNPSGTGFGTGGGAFGSTPSSTTAAGASSLFGGPKPATGFGAFGSGGNSAFGTTSAFGQTNTPATGAFGQPSTSSGGFGSGGGLFGNNKPATAFGTTQSNPNAGPYDGVAPVTTGTGGTPYSVFSEKDQTNANVTLQYQSITCMPTYRGNSFEELRVQDYTQGRKAASATGFGSSTFGASSQPSGGGLFGQNQPATQPATSAFGSFGAANNTANAAGGFGAFGQPSTQTGATNTFGAFGQPQQPQTTSAFGGSGFGATQPQQQQQPQPSSGGIFGSNNTSAFGKPAGAFGTPASGFGSTSAFGQNQQQPQQSSSVFGSNPPQQNSGFGGAFGTNNNPGTKSLFGQPQPSTGAFGGTGLFGSQQNTQGQQPPQQQQPSTGLFGNSNTGGLFGQSSQQPQPNQPNGLFGNNQQQSSTGLFGAQPSGLFGNSGQGSQPQQSQPQQQGALGGSLFGKPNTGSSLFANNTSVTQPNPLFGSSLGQPTNQQSNPVLGGSLFGKPAASTQPTGQQPQNPFGGSLFGNSLGMSNTFAGSATVPGAQGTLTASIDQPVGTNLPIFSLLPPGPHAVPLDGYGSKKKVDFFVDVPTRAPVPFAPRGSVPANSKLRGGAGPRGFASSTHLGGSANGLGSSLSFNSGKSNALTLSKGPNGRSILGSDSFSGSSLGSGGRESVKKLVVDKRVDLFELSGRTPSPSIITFNPALSVAARETEAASGPLGASRATASPTLPQRAPPMRTPNRFTAQSTGELLADKADKELKEGDYWSKPDMSVLALWGHNELVSIENLVVGRIGYGQITFLEPVDLTNSGSVKQLFGDLVRFEDKECSVYPDLDDVDKPPPGSGLNVKARIELIGCWALDKSTREPIKDETHPLAVKHAKRLKNMKDTNFEGFDIKEGKWTFTVDHF